ncbi:uncharacterized protein [Ptychodera flava]|uniref:uncharacterized protein n=1 Tax=Ptychodera flava TaxID=63121 RepID=UPI00396A5D18
MPSSPSVVDESTTSQHRMRNTAAPKFTARPRNDTIDIVQPTAVPEFAVRPRNDTIDVTPPLHESEVTTAMSGFADENSTRVDKTQKSQSTIHLNTPLSSSTAKPQGFIEINNETNTYSSSESFTETSVGTAFDATMPTTESNPASSAAGLANIDTIEAAMPSNQNSSSENLISTDENHDNDDNDDEEAETTEQPVTDSSFSAFTLGNHSTGSQEAVVATTNISMATSEIPREDATEESDTMATITMEGEANDHGSTEEPVLVTTEVTTTLYDPCSSSPCQNGGLCNQTDGNFTCECPVGFEGEFCSDNIDDCVLSPCDNGGQCIDQVNGYLCVCMSGWNGINCTYNIDECSSRDLNDCSENANCTDTEGSYHCACHDGYSGDGKICAEIDECSSNPCMNGATCLNKLSRYECRCTMGWNGTHCEQDVDECSSGVAVCDAAAECTNLDGAFRCECHDGFRGDGYTCTEIMLYPYQHSGARTLKGDDVFTEAIPFLEGFPFFGKFYTKFYVNMNGYISFDKPYQHSAPMKPFPVPAGQAILAPFWSDIDTTHGTGAVYYQSYSLSSSSEGRDLIAKVTRHIQVYFNVPDFNATYLFIATWHRVPPYPSKTYADIETALFQVAIATDRNLSYAVFNYDLGGMLWHSGNVEDRSVQVGYSDGGSHYLSLLESFTRDVYQMDEVVGNSTGKCTIV